MSSQPPDSPRGVVYTFYSYKGGVGRSMALTNVGVLMALAGKRVLLVDWDLEAPGLEAYFRGPAKLVGEPETTTGIVDLLESHASKSGLTWKSCLLEAQFLGTSLHIITAGSRTADYRKRIQQLDWDVLYRDHNVGNFIDTLREEWRAAYDFILIDSRTGITDIGDICTVLLPDAIVLMFVTNYQNIEGIKSVMARAVKARKTLPVNRSKLHGIPLPARDEVYNEYEKSREWKGIFAREFGDLLNEWLPKEVTPEDALNKLFIPYVTNWSFGERIPVLESQRETQDPTTIGAAYQRLTNLLTNRLDWYCIEGSATAAQVQSVQVDLLRERERAEELERLAAQHAEALALAEKAAQSSRSKYVTLALVSVLLAVFVGGWLYYRAENVVPPPTQSVEIFEGRQLYESGKTEEALKVFQARIALLSERRKSAPDDPLLLDDIAKTNIWLGDTLLRMGRSMEALAALRESESARTRITQIREITYLTTHLESGILGS